MALLGAKTSLSTCNFELALLLSGFKALEITRIKIARISFAVLFERFLRVQRVLPELDCLPESTLPTTRRLHELLRETFEVVAKLSSPGWMQYFLVDEWVEDTLSRIYMDTAELLASDDRGLACAVELRELLETPTRDNIPWIMKTSRAYVLVAVGRLQEAPDQHTKLLICHELCHALQLYPNYKSHKNEDEVMFSTASELLAELDSPTSQEALSALRQRDCLANHLVQVTPSDGEKCARVPEAVHFDLDPFIRGVNRTGMHLVIRVANVTLDNCVVQGKASFCEQTSRLSFFPAAEFERKSRYRVTVREREILSSLGGTLPD
ncbi:hypothetical protein PF003_g19335 [Phytophthora fragariae]|nr:hypothetical protein PF003_g19335 [Phytophthora fragariae]